jgi:hypothetical protein
MRTTAGKDLKAGGISRHYFFPPGFTSFENALGVPQKNPAS